MNIRMHKTLIKLFALCLFAAFSHAAKAGEIQNLSDKDQVVEIEVNGEYQEVKIEEGRTYSIVGLIKARFNGAEVSIEPDEQYVIWDDKTFGPQRAAGRFHN